MVIPIVKYLESHGIESSILTDGLPFDISYLRNPRNWLSRDFVVELFNRCERIFDDPLIMYKIGHEAWLGQEGTFSAFIRLLLTPRILIKFGPAVLSFTSKFYKAELEQLGDHEARVNIMYRDNRMAHRHGCFYNLGWIVGVPLRLWKTQAWIWEEESVLEEEMQSVAQLQNPPSMIRNVRFGSTRCSYRFKWVEPRYASNMSDFLRENEDLISRALSAIESEELSLQEKEFELENIKQEQTLREARKKTFLEKQGLTRREQEVALLVTQGKNNHEIADSLSISVETVKKHLNNIFKKMNVKSRSALTARIYDSS